MPPTMPIAGLFSYDLNVSLHIAKNEVFYQIHTKLFLFKAAETPVFAYTSKYKTSLWLELKFPTASRLDQPNFVNRSPFKVDNTSLVSQANVESSATHISCSSTFFPSRPLIPILILS